MERDAMRRRAVTALGEALKRIKGTDIFVREPEWYVRQMEDNFIEGVPLGEIIPDFQAGAGKELDKKICAAYSSSALAVNAFGPWRSRPGELVLANAGRFSRLDFEIRCPTGLRGTAPHLDVLADGPVTVGVESKCLEPLKAPEIKFSPAYDSICDERVSTKWFRLIKELRAARRAFRFLDAAQLVKHALGLQHRCPNSQVILLYLFWEPTNASDLEEFRQHRQEVEELADAVGGEHVRFAAESYPDLWASWERAGTPWLAGHVARLKARYQVAV
jgi:hypothetical protein